LEKLGLNLGFLIVQIFNFAIIFIVLRAWVYKPLIDMLEKRKAAIGRGLEDARIAEDARTNAEADANRILTEAQMKANEVIREATEKAEAAAHEVRAVSEKETQKAREAALAEVEGERNRMLSELRGQVVTLALAATQKLIGETLDEKRQHSLLQEFFTGVKSGKVVVLEGVKVVGESAEVTSALPLTSDEQSVIKKDLLTNLGGNAPVSFRVDPTILGGLVVRVGDRIVDGSVSGQLQELRQRLQ
jgi:F-type H+-transporting ATPase subunit b